MTGEGRSERWREKGGARGTERDGTVQLNDGMTQSTINTHTPRQNEKWSPSRARLYIYTVCQNDSKLGE